ncbi:hypothetical protein GCM10025751_18820 [Haladaptatus pallidirubidus]|uniref:Uncharacterized protein n=1 Tax=Haladaptatus pallidirubidus TaxID=1008152 RepID=A0AAV3UFK4_9EURY
MKYLFVEAAVDPAEELGAGRHELRVIRVIYPESHLDTNTGVGHIDDSNRRFGVVRDLVVVLGLL